MKTLLIELTDNKAYKLLQYLEELKLIRLVKKKPRNLSFQGKIGAQSKHKEINLGDLLASGPIKKTYVGMDSKSAMDKARQSNGS